MLKKCTLFDHSEKREVNQEAAT
uniref:Uncharacterized protein n=1 Tax=Arundo donax TaxID=35708 RepID=A0A0A9HR73_ARUDO